MALTGVQKTVLVCVASIALVVGAVVNKVTRPAPLDRNALQQAGVYLFDSPRALPEVSLRSAADQPWGLDDLNGQWDLLFFGYTFCPDICPTTLAELRQLMQKLPEETRGQLQVTLVSVDPNRDTPEQLVRPSEQVTHWLSPEQYFFVYFTNVSNAQLAVLDREMRTESAAYLGYVDCSGWTPLKTGLALPQVALRLDKKIITAEDDDGNANLHGYRFDEFGYEVVGVTRTSTQPCLISGSTWESRNGVQRTVLSHSVRYPV